MSFVPQASRVRFVLARPSHPGNVGSTARAIRTMGFSRLYVVAPKLPDCLTDPQARALAAHATDVLDEAVLCDNLLQALEGVGCAYALSGYSREFGPPLMTLPKACEQAQQKLDSDQAEIAFVFGNERSGLTNEEMMVCQYCVAIPADPTCDSLNLSQAAQVTAYQLQLSLKGDALSKSADRFEAEAAATVPALEGLFSHLQEALVASGALDERNPKHMMPRLRRLFARASLSQNDVDILRGICAAIICSKQDRAGSKKQRG